MSTKTPEELATLADQLKAVQVKRLDLKHQMEAELEVERKLRRELIAYLLDSKVNGVQGTSVRVSLKYDNKPMVADWDALYEHIRESGSFEFLHRRLTETAVVERWENGEDVPGVSKEQVINLSMRKPD